MLKVGRLNSMLQARFDVHKGFAPSGLVKAAEVVKVKLEAAITCCLCLIRVHVSIRPLIHGSSMAPSPMASSASSPSR
jgi:hypothetical protein